VVVIQTLIFIVFVAVISTVSGLAPVSSATTCPLTSAGTAGGCPAGAQGLLAAVGSGNPGNQFAKCLLAIVTVWLMLEVPKRISQGEMSTYRSLRGLASASSGVVLGGALMARSQAGPRAARFGANMGASWREATGQPGALDHERASRLEAGELAGQPSWPQVRGYESREQFIGRYLVGRPEASSELARVMTVGPEELERMRADQGSATGQKRLLELGTDYVRAQGARLHDLDAAYLNSLRRGKLQPLAPGSTDRVS
jgi:hypothetical protein